MSDQEQTTENPGVDALRKLEGLDWSKAINVPPGDSDRQEIRIFPNPAYIEIDHNIPLFNPSNILERKHTPPINYAVYFFGIMPKGGGNVPEEIRTLRFPVVARENKLGLEDEIFEELSQQTGKPVGQLRGESSFKKIGVIAGNISSNIHESLRMIFKTQPCVEMGTNYELSRDYPDLDAAIYSGWNGSVEKNKGLIDKNLVIITNPSKGAFWEIDVGIDQQILTDVAGNIMSPPITSDTIINASKIEIDLIDNLVKNNS
ncbi:MAG: hypothetical protein UT24_C0001G0077 [Candidatus Woesebacteria bacterium GW2011_GWB1_39_12]|uniref:Uncharacterized protein n=2 Tax=Candidatus Woeseibacteriota TaxID=1752722 RepID=A0A0G0QAT0_9BACT|nr:MAG: hypothetical protein UT23_C0001G0077 [Candidatus Woesebacteria bacterium GW2011_GWA1_39_12]KKR01917.1 MAG: hypothetical protein UT24_C0001G0077 [Candidatus Woesebacteria bacterium GW2011_GWB1_39_12]